MSKLIPIISGVTGTAVIAVGGSYLISTQKTIPTIKDSFKQALIKLDNSEEELLKTKLTKLKEGTILSKNKKLQEAKDKEIKAVNGGLAELKEACREIYKENFTNKDSEIFKDFQAYCARTNKDKIAKGKWNEDGKNPTWVANHNKLNSSKNTLVDTLKQISTKTSKDGNELKTWCEKNGELVFEGNADQAYKNIQEFCTKP